MGPARGPAQSRRAAWPVQVEPVAIRRWRNSLFDFPVPRKGPYGIRKYPCGVFSRKAVADLLGQAMNGERIAHPLLREKRFRRFS